jgi:hypothetical protein
MRSGSGSCPGPEEPDPNVVVPSDLLPPVAHQVDLAALLPAHEGTRQSIRAVEGRRKGGADKMYY